ncbi:MAG: AAA family ATPase [Thiotrichales bacterium]|nr:AAA family ATPase [Thiotrichales bacterium]
MHLRSVQLINWRSYRNARFEFPRPHGERNVTLVMAPNEYGKTSLFEAVTLGLFGKSGLNLVPRARMVGNDAEDRLRISYSRFLEGTLHRRATETGPPRCIVKLEWENEAGDWIEIKRTWHFRVDGSHKVADDLLQIYEGKNRALIAPPLSDEDRDRWYRDWISQHFLQSSLAEFFLFDGEQVQRYANRDMSKQVQDGIEGLLGLPVLRVLKKSLQEYAKERRKRSTTPSDERVNTVESAIEDLEKKIEERKADRGEADAQLAHLDPEIENLTRLFIGREGTVALIASLMEDEQRHRSEARRTIQELTTLMAGDMALAIAGAPLRHSAIVRLESEAKREEWENGRNSGGRNLDRFIADLSVRIESLESPLGRDSHDAVLNAARSAWDALWHPPPVGCADDYLHIALTGMTRAKTIERLSEVEQHTATEAVSHIENHLAAVEIANAKRREYLELERLAPEVQAQTEQLTKLSEQRAQYRMQRDMAQLEIDASEKELGDKRAELGRYQSSIRQHAPDLDNAARADAYAVLIDDLLKEAVPHEVDVVATEMTSAWKAMAHLSDRVERIAISPDCKVSMLASDGTDLHEIEKSAGASQVFTQALITAITRVSGRIFPFVVDTPLARLSRDQRIGVLKTFTNRPGQVILLSTDQEVVDDKLDAIRHRIAKSYELRITHDYGVAVTTVHELDLGSVGP